MTADELATLLALTEIDGIGDRRALELFRAFDSRAALAESPLAAFDDFHYVTRDTVDQLRGLPDLSRTYGERFERYRENGVSVIGVGDARYPEALSQFHSPLVLYAKGNVSLLQDSSVSVSGSRDTNQAGKDWVRQLSRELAEDGYTIVSGGALGADTAAHRGALDATGSTVVVLGTGVDRPYPEENAAMFADIVEQGGLLLSHREPTAEPARYAFLDRNRTISALSPGLIVVATDGTGGTMSQYEDAVDQNRVVFVPDSAVQVRPAEGLSALRAGATTETVSSAEQIDHELSTRPRGEGSAEGCSGQGSDDSQTSLDRWE